MKLKNKKKLTNTILFFSLFLIFFGLYVSTLEESELQEDDKGIIYTVEPDSIKVDDSSHGENPNKSNNDKNKNNNYPDIVSEKSIILTLEQQNDNMRKKLQRKYGITIKYGEETANYSIAGMSTTTIKDPTTIQDILNELAIDLSQFPQGFFKEFSKKDLSLTIYLIDKYSQDNVTGVTDPRSDNVTISIAAAYPFSESFYHESFHYIERYIKLNGGTFSSWEVLNPKDFSYGTEDLSYSYANTYSATSYFVNSYAETSAYEDRASTFEFMMAEDRTVVFQNGTPINRKARYIADVIDLFFTTVKSSTQEYWERYI